MAMFGLILHIVTIMSLRFEVRGEMTADLVISLLKETYSLKSELRTSVAAINDRIDNIENISKSPLHLNTYSTEVQGKRNEMVDPENKNPNDRILRALTAEKIYVSNVLTDYEKKLIAFQSAVSDQMNVMNTTIEASRERMGRTLEENTGIINKSVHQLLTNSETKFQDVIKEFETAMNNASIEHDTTRSDLNEIQSTLKDIEDDPKSVGFTATYEQSMNYFARDIKIIVFDNVTNNHGGGYNERTGIFTAPRSGFYIFHFSVDLYSQYGGLVHLYVGNSRMAEIVREADGINMTGSNTTVAYMSLGQQAYVRFTPNLKHYVDVLIVVGLNSFIGVLVN